MPPPVRQTEGGVVKPNSINLRPWAREHRYRWRFEESYKIERPENRADGRWFIEILCQHGLIYPFGGTTLLAYATPGIKQRLATVPGVSHHQTDGRNEVFKFPIERLDEVAAILKPRKRRPGGPGRSPEQMRAMREQQNLLTRKGLRQK